MNLYEVVISDYRGSRPDTNSPIVKRLIASTSQEAVDNVRKGIFDKYSKSSYDYDKLRVTSVARIINCKDWK